MISFFLKKIGIFILSRLWVLNGYIGLSRSLKTPERLTVVIPSYSKARVNNLAPLTRSILKCRFVKHLIVSNHNPEIVLQDWITIKDKRLTLINQPARRGCGYGWRVAYESNSEYIIVIDDDLSIFPGQLAKLFKCLLENSDIPHGLVGRRDGRFYRSQEIEVDKIYQIYAVTRQHLRKYFELVNLLVSNCLVSEEDIEFWGDDLVISRTGNARPRIHDVGYILRHPSSNAPGIATYLEADFRMKRDKVTAALDTLLAPLQVS